VEEIRMRLDSARGLKRQLLEEVVEPFSSRASQVGRMGAAAMISAADAAGVEDARTAFGVRAGPFANVSRLQRSIALGVARRRGEYRLAVRVQRPGLFQSALVERLAREASGEVDVQVIGRIVKRAKARRAASRRSLATVQAVPWYQRNTRPLLIGASVGHVDVTAGTIGGFVERRGATFVLSNNHVLANENLAERTDWVLQRASYDGGRQPAERVARLRFWVTLKKNGTNFVDAAIAEIESDVRPDVARLRELINGRDRTLAGVGPEFVDAGETVYKIGRTTGPTRGRVTAFDIDNVIVNYDMGNLRFDNQIEIEGTGNQAFSDGGDSGSLIVNASMEAVGLLFAGGDVGGSNGLGLTYANPIHRVLKDLKSTLLF
jgi:hypothetical protein